MTQPDLYAALAAVVLAKCAAYDPYLTEPTEEQARAWGEQLARWELNDKQILMAAVAEVYADNGSGYRPLPKDICDAARKLRAQRATEEPLAALEARQARQDARFGDKIAAVAAAPATVEARRRAIEAFAAGRGIPGNDTVVMPHDRHNQRIAEVVARQRAAAPPAPMDASDTNAPRVAGQCPPVLSGGSQGATGVVEAGR